MRPRRVAVEEEYLAHIDLPDGTTVYERARDAVAIAYDTGELRPMLPSPAKRPR